MSSFEAMLFARQVHATQRRKYTGNPYADHLAEVAGIVATVAPLHGPLAAQADDMIAIAWLHDTIEDQGVTEAELRTRFGDVVADGVVHLTDVETGTRAERKAAALVRLAKAPAIVQTIKVADLMSNTSSIVQHDPVFAVTYLEEKRRALEVLTKAAPRLLAHARAQVAMLLPEAIERAAQPEDRAAAVGVLTRELGTIGDVSVNLMPDKATWWVAVKPTGAAPLWWYASGGSLMSALKDARKKAVRLGFLKGGPIDGA